MNKENTNNVEERREQKIQDAVQNNNWSEVSRILDQPLKNLERRDRYHGKVSLDENTSRNNDKPRERHDIIASPVHTPEQTLLKKEVRSLITENLSEKEQAILTAIVIEKLSYRKTAQLISEQFSPISDKTVKKTYDKIIAKLREVLKDFK